MKEQDNSRITGQPCAALLKIEELLQLITCKQKGQ